MSYPGRLLVVFVSFVLASGALAQARLDLRIEPPNAELKRNIEGHVGSLDADDEEQLQRLSRVVEAQARRAGEALGYYQARITSEVRSGREGPRLVLRIVPGEPVRLRNVDIRMVGEALALKDFRLPASRELRPGARLDHGHYEDAKRLIQNQASRYGFFRGRFTRHRLDIDPLAGVADIELVYDSGPRYRLGEVSFSGDSPFDDELLQRMVPFPKDVPYDSELIADLYESLQGSGYFDGVRVDAVPAQASGESIPVNVQLTTRKPRTFGIGGGFSTDVGPRGRFNWTRHWANRQGHSYGFESELSAPRQNVGLWYDVPLDPPLTDKLRFAGGYQYEEIADTDSLSKLLKIGPEWHHRLDSGWQQVLSLKWQREEYELGDDSGLSNLVMPGASYSYLQSDDRLDPSNGYRIQADVAVAKKGLLSDADVVHGNLMLKGLTTLWTRHRFLGRLQVGGTETTDYDSIPPSLRYFAGGDQSVRGYDYQSLSPEDREGRKVGGRYLIAGSLEYQYAFADKWRAAAFVDQGNAFESLEIPTLKTGVGFGIRWVSPVGPLRLDLARALDDDGGFRLHFSMGPEL
ncbi:MULTISPECIES: autotransporter assembly complex protein TamA [unclassified Pseudomonas]|uniref:autotransporter assembly complex protein TamA n=1 Tax=unclassified Pseudomonas TaxID=196821 RepID=UPI00244BB438|nr:MULTISPECIES: autotransporter assembly complex protein TamA [unclassified Pseudomonas]MDG9930930.1 autotransporter assembly complex protein TamA [Pseudomonas sp. GD04042]MDH0485353.1 autotransporter assembly complex protein TamA [Pseudomonas sp. GD04015]MDH0606093.1 autotransporter assembly complex protein TamA [Pseudomonas sp. GD03869]